MHILQEGYGTWDGSIVNARNPARRDVHDLGRAARGEAGDVLGEVVGCAHGLSGSRVVGRTSSHPRTSVTTIVMLAFAV